MLSYVATEAVADATAAADALITGAADSVATGAVIAAKKIAGIGTEITGDAAAVAGTVVDVADAAKKGLTGLASALGAGHAVRAALSAGEDVVTESGAGLLHHGERGGHV